MPAEKKGAEMPREQVNTPARRVVRRYPIMDTDQFEEGWNIMQEGDAFPTEEGTHIEHTPTLYLGWAKGRPKTTPGQSPDAATGMIYIEIAEEEILREARVIEARRKKADEDRARDLVAPAGWSKPAGGWTSQMSTFFTVLLTREEMNGIISTTRRMRNAVYGQDA